MSMQKRILLAKMGLDCPDSGIVTVAQILRDAGYEVVYLGLHNEARQVIKVATEEDVDAIGISFLSGQHMTQVRRLLDEMRSSGFAVPVICGGIIPDEDARALKEMGVADVIPAGTLSAEVARRVAASLAEPA